MIKEFEKLGLSKELIGVLEKKGFKKPTEIQEKAIPLVLAGKDVIGGSATGSGKTLAFSASILENLQSGKGVQALILTPTRELAEQVSDSINSFSRNKNLKTIAVYGGVSINPQIKKIKNADVIVGTPGRLLDHLNRKTLDLRSVKFLVIDEVDRLFDMGFHEDVERIINKCPKDRQTMLFSATVSSDVWHLAKKYTKNPEEVSVKSYIDYDQLEQVYYDTPNNLKFSLLVYLLKEEESKLIMVFCSTRRNVDFVAENLKNLGINAQAIHGGLNQNKRSKVMEGFQGKGANVLVCTDVAARGLDIEGVSHVYNYDIPSSSKEYVHRIGRTARAGKYGKAINILSSRDYDNFGEIMQDDSLDIKREPLPELEIVSVRTDLVKRRGSRRSSRGGRNQRGRSQSRGGRRGRNRGDRSRGNQKKSYGRRGNENSRKSGKGGKGRKRFSRKRDPRGSMSAKPYSKRN